MLVFEKTENLANTFNTFAKKIDATLEDLEPYCYKDLVQIRKLKKLFILKTLDFLNKDRKLNIGFIGQVKTGRSTFLNTFLFDGLDILPKAVTPKTVTVTKILYSSRNSIEVEYYSPDEWNSIVESASDEKFSTISHEILEMARRRKVNLKEFVGREKDTIPVNDFKLIQNILNEYIGENGMYTPFVKNISIYLKNDALKSLCIFDTPGMNDPVISRTKRTKNFLETCDVVFFLSRSSQFLDKTDIEILTNIIPKKGVKKLVLLCSRFDDALTDILPDSHTFEEAAASAKKMLTIHAASTSNKLIELFKKNNAQKDVISILKSLGEPVFISSIAQIMSNKNLDNYSFPEHLVYKNLNYFKNLDQDVLKEIGNFAEIEKIFQAVASEKDFTLNKKLESFIPDTSLNIKLELESIRNIYFTRANFLSFNSESDIVTQKNVMLDKTKNIKANLDKFFYDFCEYLEENKNETVKNLEKIKEDSPALEEQELKESFVTSTTDENFKWFNPMTWGKKETRTIVVEQKYTYIPVSDALDKIKVYADKYRDTLDKKIENVVDVSDLKFKMLSTVLDNHNIADENFDPLYYKFVVKRTLNSLIFPSLDVDLDSILNLITEKFTGDVRNTSDKNSIRILFSYCIRQFYEESYNKLDFELDRFKDQLIELKEQFYRALRQNIEDEFNSILNKYHNKDVELEKYKTLIEKISYYLNEVY